MRDAPAKCMKINCYFFDNLCVQGEGEESVWQSAEAGHRSASLRRAALRTLNRILRPASRNMSQTGTLPLYFSADG